MIDPTWIGSAIDFATPILVLYVVQDVREALGTAYAGIVANARESLGVDGLVALRSERRDESQSTTGATNSNLYWIKPDQVDAMREAAYEGRHGQRDDESPALFPSQKSDRMSGKALNDVVKRLAERGDIRPYASAGRGEPDDVTAHTLRHSVAWRMLRAEEGNTLYDVRNRLRHATILTTERKYDHFQTI